MAHRRQYFFLGFVAVSIIFLIFQIQLDGLAIFSSNAAVLDVIEALIFFAYAFVFLTSGESGRERARMSMKILFIANIILVLAVLYSTSSIISILYDALGRMLFFILLYFLLLIPVCFLIAIGRTIFPFGRGMITAILLSCALLLLAFYYYPGVIFKIHAVSDEMFIAYQGVGLFLHGMDPYSVPVGGVLYSNFTNGYVASITLTTTNRLAVYSSYPALYMLSFLPFYVSSTPTPYNFDLIDTDEQYALFTFTALVSIIAILEAKYLRKPIYILLLFFTFLMISITSTVAYLLIPFLILAYVKIESKYAWIFLGICASFQELLWIPAILLILYSANNYGFRKGLRNAFGAIAVFLMINAYFIALSPSAFFQHVFEPLTQLELPNSIASIGYLILSHYGVALSSLQVVFDIVLLLLIILFLYMNEKKLIAIFSMLPFVFLSHSVPFYFSFFILFAFLVMFVKVKKPKGYGIFGSWLRKNAAITAPVILLLVLCATGILYLSHVEYENAFSLSLTGGNLTVNNATNTTTYTAVLHYGKLSNYTVYLFFFGVDMGNLNLYGIYNQSLLDNSVDCRGQSYTCMLNVNKIELNPDNSSYKIVANIKASNQSRIVRVVSLGLYNDEYLYIRNFSS